MHEKLFSQLTESSHRVLQLAQAEARQQGYNYVSTEQLLLGLLLEDKSLASQILRQMGATVGAVRSQVALYSGSGTGFVAVEPPLTLRAQQALYRGSLAARQLKNPSIGTHHILLGILREADVISLGILETVGIDPVVMEKAILRRSPSDVPPESVLARFSHFLTEFVELLDIGSVHQSSPRFTVMTGDVMTADLVCTSHRRLTDGVPDIVVELCSETKPDTVIQTKMLFLLAVGMRAGIQINSQARQATVYSLGGVKLFTGNDTLVLTGILPGFELSLGKVWD